MAVSSEVCSFGFENRASAEQGLGGTALHYMTPYTDGALSGAIIGGEINEDAFDAATFDSSGSAFPHAEPKASDVARQQLNREAAAAEVERRKRERAAEQQPPDEDDQKS